MTHETPLIALLSVGLVLAFVMGSLAHRLKLSPLVGYLLAGMLVGPFTPGFVGSQAMATELADVGVILLMFGVGLHFSPQDLLQVRKTAIPGALAGIAAATALGWALAWALGWPPVQGFVFGLALSVASTVVLLRSLEDHRLLSTTRGKVAIGWVIVEDLVMVLALVFLPALAHSQSAGTGAFDGNALLASLAATLGKLAVFVTVMLVVGRRLIPWLLEHVAGYGSRELFTLSILAIALGVAFGSATLFGVSFALGAFFAGTLLNESELSHRAAANTLPMRDAFAVLFFVSVGMLFDPTIIVRQPMPVLAAFLIITVGKPAVAFLIVQAMGQSKSTALTIWVSLAQIGEFSFILAGLAVGLGLLPPAGRDLVLASALLSITANPMLFAGLMRWQARHDLSDQARPATIEPLPGPPLPARDHVILVGYGRVGRQLAKLLHDRGVSLAVIEGDLELVAQAHADGVAAIHGNAAAEGRLHELFPATATHALIAIPQAFESGTIIARLRQANANLTILARAHSETEMRHLFDRGADGAVMAERELAYSMAEMALGDPKLGTRRPPSD